MWTVQGGALPGPGPGSAEAEHASHVHSLTLGRWGLRELLHEVEGNHAGLSCGHAAHIRQQGSKREVMDPNQGRGERQRATFLLQESLKRRTYENTDPSVRPSSPKPRPVPSEGAFTDV